MRSFDNYIYEAKNTHLTHLEDIILLDGPKGALKSVNFLKSIIDMLSPSLAEAKITLKWDGSPAVVAGIDPVTKKFFVGTKAAFSKGNPKLNFTNADIDKNHGGAGDLPEKLKAALKYLPSVWKKGVYQGDMMFIKSQLKKATIDGEPSITFRPNNITYASPLDSDLGKKIASSKFGIVFHTKYTGKTVPEMNSSFDVSASDFKPSKSVWFDDAEFKDASKIATFTNKESQDARKIIKSLQKDLPSVRKSLTKIFAGPKANVSALIRYNNSTFKTGEGILPGKKHYENFITWFMAEKHKKLKTFNAEKEKEARAEFKSMQKDYMTILDFYNEIKAIKKIIIARLNKIKTMRTFLLTDKGYKVVGHEGFVAITNDGSSIKLVDRMEFTKNLFTTDKAWSK